MARVACAMFLVLALTAACTPGRAADRLPPEVIAPAIIKELEKEAEEQKKAAETRQRKQQEELRKFEQLSRWVLWFVIGLAGAIGGGWTGKQVLARKPPAAHSATACVTRLGLGADGKGGVWLRERPPWAERSVEANSEPRP